MQWFALNASLEGVCCLPPGTLGGSICDRFFLTHIVTPRHNSGGGGDSPPPVRSIPDQSKRPVAENGQNVYIPLLHCVYV